MTDFFDFFFCAEINHFSGIFISEVDKLSSAHKQGLSRGDKIVEVNGIKLNEKTTHNEAVKVTTILRTNN